MFESSPIHIIERFLEGFSTDGELVHPVPRHVLEALAVRLRSFFEKGSTKSLDAAFGGRTARQRQARHAADMQFTIAWKMYADRIDRRTSKSESLGRGTPSEVASEAIAVDLGMSVDNVRRLYKNSARKARRP